MGNSRNKQEEKKGAPEWMTTYGDMVTLLLTFFVLLFSFSSIDAQKWQALVNSLQGNIGILDGGKNFTDGPGIIDNPLEFETPNNNKKDTSQIDEEDQHDDEFIKLYKSMEKHISENGISAEIELSESHSEILLRFKDYILFDSGKVDIKPEAGEILDGVGELLITYKDQIGRIRVEGHADSRPINTAIYPTNWELSGARAAKVVRYFQEHHSLPGNILSSAGYGEYYPIDTNGTPEGMARNRRVDILIVKTIVDNNTAEVTKE